MKMPLTFTAGLLVGVLLVLLLASGGQTDNKLRCDALSGALVKYTETTSEMTGFMFGKAMRLYGLTEKQINGVLNKVNDPGVQKLARKEYLPTLKLHLKKIVKFCGCSG